MKKQQYNIQRIMSFLMAFFMFFSLISGIAIPKAYASGQVWNYDYTGNVQSFTVPYGGTYQIEVWGAEGGDSNWYNRLGGKGGYAKGNVFLNAGETIYIYVGGQGTSVNSGIDGGGTTPGGYNGGGIGSGTAGAGGGGGTDIRKGGTNISNRIIVAGGGGGAGPSGNGVDGGSTDRLTNTLFQGQDGYNHYHGSWKADEGGGGGGYYGGNLYHGDDSYGGGGGSNYIGGVSNGTSSIGVRTGNGYAKITSLNSPPVVNIASPSNNTTFNMNSSFTLSGTISDTDNNGRMYVKYSIDNGTTQTIADLNNTNYNQNFSNNISLTGFSVGSHTLRVWGEDSYGASSNPHVLSFTIKDNIAPTVSVSGNPTTWTKQSITLTVNASDNESGIHRIVLPNGNNVYASSTNFTVSENGSFIFYVYDNAGNSNSQTINVNRIDKIIPSLNIAINYTDWTNQDVVISVLASDNESGFQNIKLPDNNVVITPTTNYTVSENGKYTFVATDLAGNSISQDITITNIDKTNPSLSHSMDTSWAKGSTTLEINASDNQSGIKGIIDAELLVNGLTGEYRQHTVPTNSTPPILLGDKKLDRIDSNVDFNWLIGSPDSQLSTEGFNVTWRGFIKSPVTGEVTFETITDDGVRLKVGNQLIIDKWVQQSSIEWTGTIHLEEGKLYPIQMDYYENTGGATAKLLWKYEGLNDFEIIPNQALFTGGFTENSKLTKTLTRNGDYEFFTVDNAGNTTNHLVSVNNIYQDEPHLNVTPIPEEDYIKLEWTAPDDWQKYNYMIYSKNNADTDYQTIPVKDNLKVLEVYPYISVLKDWTNAYGRGKISLDSVTIEDFNSNPISVWDYDVVVFGFGDSNMGKDLNSTASNEVEKFIKAGKGVLFGHDTLRPNALSNFQRLSPYLNLTFTNESWSSMPWNINVYENISKIKTTRKGFLTNYPYEIGSIGTVLTTPFTHTVQQISNGDIWLRFDFEDYMSNKGNFYLTTWNNTAMIQTGHSIRPNTPSNNYATEDEQKLIMNTLFYLAQITNEVKWDDHSGQDVSSPDKPIITDVSVKNSGSKVDINFTRVEDNGTTYNYYVEATGERNGIRLKSEIKTATIKSGFKGYSIVVDKNPNTIPDNEIETTATNLTINKEVDSNFYVHVASIDNVGNMSEVAHYHYTDNKAPTLNVVASKTNWTNENVVLTATAFDAETGVKRIQLPNGNWVNNHVVTYEISSNGTYNFVAEDLFGNRVENSINISNIDKMNPTQPSILTNENWIKADFVNVAINHGADTQSGINHTEYKLEGATNQEWTTYNSTIKIVNEGETKITARTIDNVDNISNEVTAFVRIDRSIPYNSRIIIELKP